MSRPPGASTRIVIAIALTAAAAECLTAQAPKEPLPLGTIAGSVLDASTEHPLEGSTIVLRLLEEGLVTAASETTSPFLAQARQAVTGVDGAYAFTGLAAGRYQLHVHRLGYGPAVIGIELSPHTGSRLSVGLTMAPVRLMPLPVVASPTIAFRDSPAFDDASSQEDARVRAARARQRRYLSSDVREVTHADVVESVTLGETDLFRALQRLPGVTTFGDFTAELWTRGSRWDHTRVYFDGVPLFAPLHRDPFLFTQGMTLSGISTDVLGAAVLLPGVRPAEIGEGAAAVLDLRSAPARPDGELHGIAELTLFNGRVAASRGSRDGRSGWSLAARHNTSDVFGRMVDIVEGADSHRQYYEDVTGRWDLSLFGSTQLSTSGILSRDITRSSGARAEVRNLAISSTLATPISELLVEHTAGLSLWTNRRQNDELRPYQSYPQFGGDTAQTSLVYLSFGGMAGPRERQGSVQRWRAGYAFTYQYVDKSGFLRLRYDSVAPKYRLESGERLPTLSIFGERTVALGSRLTLAAGLRVDGGGSIEGTGFLRPMPRLQLRFAGDSLTSFSFAVGRSFQYSQAREFSEIPQGTSWWLAGPSVPALRTDVATLGLERWVGSSWLLNATAYSRRSGGVAMRDYRVDTFLNDTSALFASERSHGLEVGIRRLAGRVTGSAGYTLATTQVSSVEGWHRAPQDRPHALDATLLFRATPRFQMGAAYTRMSGRPFTPRYLLRDTTAGSITSERFFGSAFGARTGTYESLDLSLDWTGFLWGMRTGMFVQLRNVLGPWPTNQNSFLADWDDLPRCTSSRPGWECRSLDVGFEHRIHPFVPLLGFRLAF